MKLEDAAFLQPTIYIITVKQDCTSVDLDHLSIDFYFG